MLSNPVAVHLRSNPTIVRVDALKPGLLHDESRVELIVLRVAVQLRRQKKDVFLREEVHLRARDHRFTQAAFAPAPNAFAKSRLLLQPDAPRIKVAALLPRKVLGKGVGRPLAACCLCVLRVAPRVALQQHLLLAHEPIDGLGLLAHESDERAHILGTLW